MAIAEPSRADRPNGQENQRETMMRIRSVAHSILTILILGFAFARLGAQTEGQSSPVFSWGLDDIKTNWFAVPTGPILVFGYGSLDLFPGLRTDFEGKVGVGYENFGISRDEATGDPRGLGIDGSSIDMVNGQMELGFRQGLVSLEATRDILSVFASVHARAANNFGALQTSGFTDRNRELMGSVIAGLKFANDAKNDHGLRSGFNACVEGEWGPSVLSAQGTDFFRFKAEWLQYLPLFDLPGKKNLLSSYLVLRANAKYIDGSSVPLFMLEGTDVRAYPLKLDTKSRASGTAEIRLDLPSFLGASDIFPILFAFADIGWYSGFNDLPAASAWRDSSGPLGSVGGGFAIDIFGFARPVISIGYAFIDQDSQGIPIVGAKAFWWDIGFDLHI